MKGILLCAFSRLPVSANGNIHRIVSHVRESLVQRQPVYLLSTPAESEFHPVLGSCYGRMMHIKVPRIYDSGQYMGESEYLQILRAKKVCIEATVEEVEVIEINNPWRTPLIKAVFERAPEAQEIYKWALFERTVVNPRCIGMDETEFLQVMRARITVIPYADTGI